ncbi:hypothetical protein EDD15DRAFT_182254 [Pisolithus albus]|nr:hypothetical protein EDD15DRAFT_182254 [Pisolithus albus]
MAPDEAETNIFFRTRRLLFIRTDSMVVLQEAISVHGAALEHTPPSNRCRALLSLAGALHEQFEKQGTENSLVEGIRLRRASARRDIPIMRCLEIMHVTSKRRSGKRQSVLTLGDQGSALRVPDIERSIKRAVSVKVAKIPLLLLYTPHWCLV